MDRHGTTFRGPRSDGNLDVTGYYGHIDCVSNVSKRDDDLSDVPEACPEAFL